MMKNFKETYRTVCEEFKASDGTECGNIDCCVYERNKVAYWPRICERTHILFFNNIKKFRREWNSSAMSQQ